MKKLAFLFATFLLLGLVICFTISCQNKAEKAELEKFRAQAKVEEQNKELFRKMFDEMNKGNYGFLYEVYAPNYAYYYPSKNIKPVSREEKIGYEKSYRESFPDINISIEESVATGDMVISRFIVRGTHKGKFEEITATGNRIELSMINMCRIRKGKIVEEREEGDVLGMMQQLGMELKPNEAEKK